MLATGCIDWRTRTIRSHGVASPAPEKDGEPPATPSEVLNTARRTARDNLLETVQHVRINAASRVKDRVVQSSAFRDGLIALVNNASITHQAYLSDGTLEIELTMNMTGGFAQFVLPEEIHQVEPVTTVTASKTKSEAVAAPEKRLENDAYTGLIIDASGIGATPSMVPVVVDESDAVVYGPAIASREFAVSRGMSGFSTTLHGARDDQRVGERPMVVKAIRIRPPGRTELVISIADAARLRSSVVHLEFLKACRVNIVMDQAGSP